VLGRRDRKRPAPDPAEEARLGFGENPQMPYEVDSTDRRIVSQVLQRPFQDRAFSVAIKAAYQDTCGVTGLKLINWRRPLGGPSSTHPSGDTIARHSRLL